MTATAITLEAPDRGGQGLTASLQDLDATVVAISAVAATSMEIPNDGDIVVAFINTDSVARTVVVKAVPDPYGRGGSGVGDVTYTIPIGNVTPQMALVPLMNPAMFNNVGVAQLTISQETVAGSLKAAVIRLKKVR